MIGGALIFQYDPHNVNAPAQREGVLCYNGDSRSTSRSRLPRVEPLPRAQLWRSSYGRFRGRPGSQYQSVWPCELAPS